MCLTFDAFSDRHKPVIEAHLGRFFTDTYGDARDQLSEAIRYSLLARAKRIRPLLIAATYRLWSESIEPVLPLCSAVEMLHTYSLIHDDLPAMDNDDFRRGLLTCHKKFGEEVAILAGDTLNTFAFELLIRDLPLYFSNERVLKVVYHFARACGIEGMAGGQMLDLMGDKANFSEPYVRHIHYLKTGTVLQACVTLPAILQDISDDTFHALSQFGCHLGVLFQIADDILDVVGTSEILGKTSNKDESQNKQTYVRVLGLDGAQDALKKEHSHAQNWLLQLEKNNHRINELQIILDHLVDRGW